MSICAKCGAQNKDDASFCGVCGAALNIGANTTNKQGTQNSQKQNDFSEKVKNLNNTKDTTGEYDKKDIEANMGYAIVSYIAFLFVIPLIFSKNSKFARYHANQGLVLFICEIVVGVIFRIITPIFGAILPFMTITLNSILGLVNLLFIVLAVIGIVNAANGTVKELPVIGNIKIIK